MNRNVIREVLMGLGVPPALVGAMPDLPNGVGGLLIYGSQARGDAVAGSDLDLLAVVDHPRASTSSGNVNISYYTLDQLSTGIGTLFGAHLKRDAKIIWDDSGSLAIAIDSMGEVDADRLLRRAAEMTELFTSPERDLPRYLPGLLREARYLLRSCLYTQAIAAGDPCFSVRELAERHDDPELALLLASRQAEEPAIDDLDGCLFRLQRIVGEFPPSTHGSLEATIVNEWERPGDLLSMAFLALGTTGQAADYAEVEKILL